MRKKRNKRRAIALVITALLGTGLLSDCGFNTSKQTSSNPYSQGEGSDASSAISSAAGSVDAGQDAVAAAFLKIEPAILKRTQNAAYTYATGKLSFTVGTDTSDFPPKYVSTIFNPQGAFLMPSSIFVSADKIAVVRTPDSDSIVITYSDDGGETWRNSDAIHTEQIPDRSTGAADFLGKDQVNHLLSLFVDFPSKATGFLIIGSDTAMGTQYTQALFKTTDGGKKWFALDSNIGIIHGFPITGMFFQGDKNGFFVQSGMNVNRANVCRTTDGGVTWSTDKLPVPATLVDYYTTSILTALPPYHASGQWLLPMFIQPNTLIYFQSSDQGKSWSYDSAMNRKVDQFLSSDAS